jgi:formate hydrogenlyase subunit 3/multisubunit Na+/H+ antiporter MnhD subunit
MEVIAASLFSALIILITVFAMVKVLLIAYKRKEISQRKLIIYTTTSIIIGFTISILLPYGYQEIFDQL